MKVYDKAKWQLSGGISEKDVISHFKFMFKWLKKHKMLSVDGIEVLRTSIDEDVVLTDEMVTINGKKFLDKYYDRYISQIEYGKKEDSKLLDKMLNNSGFIANESTMDIIDIKIAIYEKEMNGEITEEERDYLIERIDEKFFSEATSSVPAKIKKLSKIEDDSELKDTLISYAEKSKFSKSDYKRWSETYSDKDTVKIEAKLRSMDLGKCLNDIGDNLVVYSSKTQKFYFFDHEMDGLENLASPIKIERIKKIISDWM